MHFTTDELILIAASLSSTNPLQKSLIARIRLAIAKSEVAALTKKPAKPAKEVK